MSNFSFSFRQTIHSFSGDLREVIQISIRNEDNEFEDRAATPFISDTDGNSQVDGFFKRILGNKKELAAYFPIDAFYPFTGTVNIIFGFGFIPMGEFKDVDIQNTIVPLSPDMTSFNAQPGDTSWYNSLT